MREKENVGKVKNVFLNITFLNKDISLDIV